MQAQLKIQKFQFCMTAVLTWLALISDSQLDEKYAYRREMQHSWMVSALWLRVLGWATVKEQTVIVNQSCTSELTSFAGDTDAVKGLMLEFVLIFQPI